MAASYRFAHLSHGSVPLIDAWLYNGPLSSPERDTPFPAFAYRPGTVPAVSCLLIWSVFTMIRYS